MPSGMAPHEVWEIVQGQSAQRVEIEPSWGRGEEMATQEQKIVQSLGGGAGSTHLMCPHCGKRVDLTYRSSYELALDDLPDHVGRHAARHVRGEESSAFSPDPRPPAPELLVALDQPAHLARRIVQPPS